MSWKYFSFLIWKLKNLVSLNSTHSRLADPRSNSLEGARRGIVMGQGGGEERRKINDGARERLNVRPTSINMASRPRRSPRLARFCTRPAKISARQYRTMPDCRHYGGHCRGLDMSPVASGIQAAISWPPLHPLSSFRDTEDRFARKRADLFLTREPGFCCWITSFHPWV